MPTGLLTPELDRTRVPVQQWIALQAELLRDGVARGDPAATDVLRFARVVPPAPGARLDPDAARLATPERIVEYALIWAAAHDRRQVVEFLLTKDPGLRVTEPRFQATALGVARYHRRDELVALLEPLTLAG